MSKYGREFVIPSGLKRPKAAAYFLYEFLSGRVIIALLFEPINTIRTISYRGNFGDKDDNWNLQLQRCLV